MPRSFLIRVVLVVVVLVAILFALASIDPTRAPRRIEKVVPDNALSR